MHVVRQDDHRRNIERELLPRRGHGIAKDVDVIDEQRLPAGTKARR
jgi:hypothetical protein